MATPAWRFEVEKTLEQRLERIEVHVQHIQADVTEIKAPLSGTDQRLTGKLDSVEQKLTQRLDSLEQKLTDKLDSVEQKLTGKIDAIAETLNDLKVGRAYDKVRFLLMTVGLLWVIAKAFKWI